MIEKNYYVKWNMYILLIVMCVIVNKYVIWEDWKKIIEVCVIIER